MNKLNGKAFDADLEKRLALAVALAPEALWPSAAHLRPGDFGYLQAREAWERISASVRAGQVVDSGQYTELVDPFNPPLLLPDWVSEAAGEIVQLSLERQALSLANEIARAALAHSGDTLRNLLRGAPELLSGRTANTLMGVYEVASRVWDILADPARQAQYVRPTGLAALDRALGGGLELGTLTILMGRPGMGKTAALVQMSDAVSEHDGMVAVFSKEMSKEQWVMRMAARRAHVSLLDWKQNKLSDDDQARLLRECALIGERTGLVIDDSTPQTTAQIGDLCETVRRERGRLDCVLVDHLRLMADEADNETHRLGAVSWGLKQIARRGTRVVAAAQLSRAVEGQADRRPDLRDLRDSGEIEENADVVIALYREQYYNPAADGTADLIIRKDRNGARNACARMIFTPSRMSFEEVAYV